VAKKSAKFKDILKEAVGGVVGLNPIGGMMGGSSTGDAQMAIDKNALSDIFKRDRRKRFEGEKSVVLREDADGSVTLKRTGVNEMKLVVRRGSKEKTYNLSEEAVSGLIDLME
jgi:hypothetical protein